MEVSKLLKQHQLRKTDFRQDVLQIFISNRGRALSNADLEFELGDPDRITLYRTLRSFEEKGLIHQAIDGSGVNKYALCNSTCDVHIHNDRHAHFHCQRCGQTQCLFNALKSLNYQLGEGFKAESVEVVIKGTCNLCR
jgi:Fur family ferric uptake transcriptional regulator